MKHDGHNEYAYYDVIWSDKARYWTLIIVDNSTGKILAENPTVDRKFQLRIGLLTGNRSLSTIFKTRDVKFIINTQHFERLTSLINQ